MGNKEGNDIFDLGDFSLALSTKDIVNLLGGKSTEDSSEVWLTYLFQEPFPRSTAVAIQGFITTLASIKY